MTNPSDDSLFDSEPRANDANATIVERVQELTWALVDEQIDDDEMRLLDNLLLSDDGARDTYIACMQLHSDLMQEFVKPANDLPHAVPGQSPVLGFLGGATPTLTTQPPHANDSRA